MPSDFKSLSELQPNWDGYGALPIHPTAIANAEKILRIIQTPAQIVPCNNGTVALEWHRDGMDIEIEIGVTRATAVWFEENE